MSNELIDVGLRLQDIAAKWEENAKVARRNGKSGEASQWNACAMVVEEVADKIFNGEVVIERCPNCKRQALISGRLHLSCRIGLCCMFVHPVTHG